MGRLHSAALAACSDGLPTPTMPIQCAGAMSGLTATYKCVAAAACTAALSRNLPMCHGGSCPKLRGLLGTRKHPDGQPHLTAALQ